MLVMLVQGCHAALLTMMSLFNTLKQSTEGAEDWTVGGLLFLLVSRALRTEDCEVEERRGEDGGQGSCNTGAVGGRPGGDDLLL